MEAQQGEKEMKFTRLKLNQIIKEELKSVLYE